MSLTFPQYSNLDLQLKDAVQSAKTAQRVLALADRHETVLCPPSADFFYPEPELSKRRQHLWNTILDDKRLTWILPTNHPNKILGHLPDEWESADFDNVCFAAILPSSVEVSKTSIDLLREVQCGWRAIWVDPKNVPRDLDVNLEDIDWVVVYGNDIDEIDPKANEWISRLRSKCQQFDVAFFRFGNHQNGEADGDEGPREDPFSELIDLQRPPMQDKKPVPATLPVDKSVKTGDRAQTSDSHAETAAGPAKTDVGEDAAPDNDPSSTPGVTESPADKPGKSRNPKTSPAPETRTDAKDTISKEPEAEAPLRATQGGQSSNESSVPDVSPAPEPPAAKPKKKKNQKGAGTRVKRVKVEVVTSVNPIGKQTELAIPRELNDLDREDFQRLDHIVSRAAEIFIEAGEALEEIRRRELWRAGPYLSWDAYCGHAIGISKTHANRLINSAGVAKAISNEVTPIGVTSLERVLPRSESQVRPLLRLKENAIRKKAWDDAVKLAEGKQPTAEMVKQVVDKIPKKKKKSRPDAPAASNPLEQAPAETLEKTPERRRAELIASLKKVVKEKKSWTEAKRLVAELENCC